MFRASIPATINDCIKNSTPAIGLLSSFDVNKAIIEEVAKFCVFTSAEFPEFAINEISREIRKANHVKPEDIIYFFSELRRHKFYGTPTPNMVLVMWGEYLENRIQTAESMSISKHAQTKESNPDESILKQSAETMQRFASFLNELKTITKDQ